VAHAMFKMMTSEQTPSLITHVSITHFCKTFSLFTFNIVFFQTFCRSQYSYLASDDSEEKHNFIRQVVSVLDGRSINGFSSPFHWRYGLKSHYEFLGCICKLQM
jgi:hypothetical protein